MLVTQKRGNINEINSDGRLIDMVELHWYESAKRILHKTTQHGISISMKFLNESQHLTDGDVLYEDAESLIVVDILPTEAIVIVPANMKEMAAICYEIGNKHLPLFYYDDVLLVPYEKPLFNLLSSAGYNVKQQNKKLIYPLKTTVTPHGSSSESLFSKILKRTASSE